MKNFLILLIATYLLSGFVSTQVSVPAAQQVPIRILIAGMLAVPFVSLKLVRELSARSMLLCFGTAFAGYILGAWAFSHAIQLGGYSIAVFLTSLPWLGFIELVVKNGSDKAKDKLVLAFSSFGGVIFFAPTIACFGGVGNLPEVVAWSLVAAIAGACAQYGRRFHAPGVKSATVADGVILSATLQALVLLHGIEVELQIGDFKWLIVGGGCYFISNRLSNYVFASVPPAVAAVWMSTEPTIALLISAVFLGVVPSTWEFAGGAILFGAALYSGFQKECTLVCQSSPQFEVCNSR